jgi:hypothetical protein
VSSCPNACSHCFSRPICTTLSSPLGPSHFNRDPPTIMLGGARFGVVQSYPCTNRSAFDSSVTPKRCWQLLPHNCYNSLYMLHSARACCGSDCFFLHNRGLASQKAATNLLGTFLKVPVAAVRPPCGICELQRSSSVRVTADTKTFPSIVATPSKSVYLPH